MNRIIIIGNGFDLAHNLKTGYKDFIDDYWATVGEKIYDKYWQHVDQQYGMTHPLKDYEDKFVKIEKRYENVEFVGKLLSNKSCDNFSNLCKLINKYNSDPQITGTTCLVFKNKFFERISHQCSLVNWVDIENEYYEILKELLQEENPQKQNESICLLNKEFDDIKRLLEEYLTRITESTELKKHQSIQDAFLSYVEFDEIATYKQTSFVDSIFSVMFMRSDFSYVEDQDCTYNMFGTDAEKRMYFIEKSIEKKAFKEDYLAPYTLVLNFNYTKTVEKLYTEINAKEVINIHGELNNENNPIIFGYGDELDDNYKLIEKLQNNDFLENIKSIRYHKTRNYRSLLEFIALGPYQIFIMGHSCGNSDRTLLNTLFEHDNCLSIKVFYRQYDDGKDNYIDLIKNISRNFNNKYNMRDIVVNRESCSPLVPVVKEVAK